MSKAPKRGLLSGASAVLPRQAACHTSEASKDKAGRCAVLLWRAIVVWLVYSGLCLWSRPGECIGTKPEGKGISVPRPSGRGDLDVRAIPEIADGSITVTLRGHSAFGLASGDSLQGFLD